MSASQVQVWGEGLIQGFAGRPAVFGLNPNGLRMEGITFAVEGTLKFSRSINYFFASISLRVISVWFPPSEISPRFA